ncbi:MAG: hypothetical protein HC780_21280, partial [Leptolyngbyaceae cyanobacterium CSU_1_3]|nr:hypothetical protein [Leptolyngbyaceae cyanobacterium CSU_1_3]
LLTDILRQPIDFGLEGVWGLRPARGSTPAPRPKSLILCPDKVYILCHTSQGRGESESRPRFGISSASVLNFLTKAIVFEPLFLLETQGAPP